MLSRIIRANAQRGVAASLRTHRSSSFPTTGTTTTAAAAAVASSALTTAIRGVQFEQTSETIGAINKKDRATAAKWVTKSTKDYMEEADRKIKGNASLTNIGRERIKEDSLARRERIQAVAEEGEAKFQLEMDRIRDDTDSRWKKGINFFKRQGWAFFWVYTTAYVGTFIALYFCFATGLVKKETAFEMVFVFFGSYLDRDSFYKRIEAWDAYINVGFAFVINELLEVLRLPFVMLLFYQCRPLLTGMNQRVKKSIFRWNAAES